MSGMTRLGNGEDWHDRALQLAAGHVNLTRGVN
jgi:hypothetical protein